MSVHSLKEAFEAAVPPVQVNPLGDAQAQDYVILLSLSQQEAIVLQHIIGLRESRRVLEDAWMRRSWCMDAEQRDSTQTRLLNGFPGGSTCSLRRNIRRLLTIHPFRPVDWIKSKSCFSTTPATD